jgi:hypothetical protein
MNPKHEWFKLAKGTTIALFIYYLLLLGLSIYLLFFNLYSVKNINDSMLFTDSILITITTSVLGSTIFYVRKLYKACINLDIQIPVSGEDAIRQIGVFFYFFLRPIFSGAFAVIVLIIIKSGISILSNSKTLSSEFYYLSIAISFFIGFSCGDLIDKFEELGRKIVTKVSDINV